jgi:CMP-N,N'-diacetyllegionaminic acid synthase
MFNGKIVAVIPARGGSKGLPGKNIRVLNGKPLIVYTIEAAIKCNLIDRVICSTDDKDIAEIAINAGAEVPFIRPKHLSQDLSHTPPVIEHAVNFLEEKGIKVGLVITLQPTSPLRTEYQISESINAFRAGIFDSLVAVKDGYPPWWMVKAQGDRLQSVINFPGSRNPFNLERQELPATYQINGSIYITRRPYLKNSGSIINIENCGYYLMDEESSLDIDTLTDFNIVEQTLKNRLKI